MDTQRFKESETARLRESENQRLKDSEKLRKLNIQTIRYLKTQRLGTQRISFPLYPLSQDDLLHISHNLMTLVKSTSCAAS